LPKIAASHGQQLSASERAYFEPRFKFDFSNVRVYADDTAATAAAAQNAFAFTVGNHIVFGAHQYNTTSSAGRALLAHELVHVIQQSGGSPAVAHPRRELASTNAEREAAAGATAVLNGGLPENCQISATLPDVARQDAPVTDDVLAPLSAPQVAQWYGRLADETEKKGAKVSALLMRNWLKNRDPKATITIPAHANIVSSTPVKEGLSYHRKVYLTEQKASIDGDERWAGIIPRLQSGSWNGTGTLDMHYQGLASSGSAYVAAMKYKSGMMSQSDADLFTSLHDFQLKTEVTATGKPASSGLLAIAFSKFSARVLDRYDWDIGKHLTVPNPDAGSKKPDAVAPKQASIKVYHSNAHRVENAGLAAPYNLETESWDVKDAKVIGPAVVDPKKDL